MPAPIPWSNLEGPCATAWWWPDATEKMKVFDKMEIEIPHSTKASAEILNLAQAIAEYVLTSEKMIREGETIGRSESEKVKVSYCAIRVRFPDNGHAAGLLGANQMGVFDKLFRSKSQSDPPPAGRVRPDDDRVQS